MARKARSARGEVVDFDLIAIKQQIELGKQQVKNVEQDITKHENYIEIKNRRKIAKTTNEQQSSTNDQTKSS